MNDRSSPALGEVRMLFGSVLYEGLVNATGSGALGDVILAAADAAIGVDEVFGYRLADETAPTRIASSGRVGSSAVRASLYTERFFRMDPLAAVATSAREGEPTSFGRVITSDIFDATYRYECFERPGFAEKLSFVRRRGSIRYVLSFYRSRDRRPAAADALSDLAEITLPLLRKQAELCSDDPGQPTAGRIEARLTMCYPDLTKREREVCARTLIGMTAEAIALELRISSSTVLTYRRRAYFRYGISSAHQMSAKILI